MRISKSVEHALAAIQALDLDPIKVKLMDPDEGQGWSRDYVETMAEAYKRFLSLLVKYPNETIAPTKDLDKFWHGHILDTMKYAEDCQDVFGGFLHHFPYFGMRGEADAKELSLAGDSMQRLYAKEFGEVLPRSRGNRQIHDVGMTTLKPSRSHAGVEAAATQDAAYCYAAVSLKQASPAYCYATVVPADTAYCYANVQPKQPQDAAYCYAAVRLKQDSAYCYASVQPKQSADAAYCYAAVHLKHDSAYCYAAVGAAEAAYCYASVQPKDSADAAYCYASKPDITVRPTLLPA